MTAEPSAEAKADELAEQMIAKKTLRNEIADNWGTEVIGLALFTIGTGLLIGVRPTQS